MPRAPPGPRPVEPALVTPSCGVAPGRCELGDTLRLVSRAHVLDALDLVVRAPAGLRFGELRATLRVNANVLAMRLRDLVEAGFVERRAEGDAVTYVATPMARSLLPALDPLRDWARAHAPKPALAPLVR